MPLRVRGAEDEQYLEAWISSPTAPTPNAGCGLTWDFGSSGPRMTGSLAKRGRLDRRIHRHVASGHVWRSSRMATAASGPGRTNARVALTATRAPVRRLLASPL